MKMKTRKIFAHSAALCLCQGVFSSLVLMNGASAQSLADRAAALDTGTSAQRPSITSSRTDISGVRAQQERAGQLDDGRAARARMEAGKKANAKGEFEKYVQTVTGQELEIFGRRLFSEVPSTFAPVDATQVNPDYVIGPGDELQIRGWGMVDIDVSTTVDRSGSVYIPRVGSIKVSGVAYRDLQGHLKKAVAKLFSNFELTVSISQTRAVQVYVVGNVAYPGSYTLSAMSTLLNALFASGGPSPTGTLRDIQVKRGNTVATSFDLYDMLTKGDKRADITLRDGDVIYIPEAGPRVALTGNVKNPGIFELKGPATTADLVNWAGGLDSAAEAGDIVVEKNTGNVYKPVLEFNAQAGRDALAKLPVGPADVYRVFSPQAVPIQAKVEKEYVTVSGEVQGTGVIAIEKGETLRQLVNRLGGPTSSGYLFALQLKRESVRRAQQQRLNEIADRFERDLEANATRRLTATTDKDNLAIITAEVERQRAMAQRLRTVRAEGRVVLELSGARAQVKDLPDFPLQNGDVVFVPQRPDTVDVLGAVFQQNSFIYRPQRSISDYIELAGGVTESADKSERYVIRADGTAKANGSGGFFGKFAGSDALNPGDTIVIPEKIEGTSWTQNLKEWTAIFYQFGLGAAGLKVLKD